MRVGMSRRVGRDVKREEIWNNKKLKKKIIIQIIGICCFIWMITLEAIPNRMTYSIEEQGDMYDLSISDNQGKIIYENQYYGYPIVSKVGKNTMRIVAGKGDVRQYRFINGKTGSKSDYLENVCGCNEKLVVYATNYNEGSIKIIIGDIYKDEVYKEIIDDFIPTAIPSYAIKDVQIINNHLVYLRYYVGDSAIWQERGEGEISICKIKRFTLWYLNLFVRRMSMENRTPYGPFRWKDENDYSYDIKRYFTYCGLTGDRIYTTCKDRLVDG